MTFPLTSSHLIELGTTGSAATVLRGMLEPTSAELASCVADVHRLLSAFTCEPAATQPSSTAALVAIMCQRVVHQLHAT